MGQRRDWRLEKDPNFSLQSSFAFKFTQEFSCLCAAIADAGLAAQSTWFSKFARAYVAELAPWYGYEMPTEKSHGKELQLQVFRLLYSVFSTPTEG